MTPTDSSSSSVRGRAALAAALLLVAVPAAAQSPLDRLAWLGGCWQRSAGGGAVTIEEQWMAPRGGAMLGVSRTVRNGAVAEYEFLRIFAAGDTLVYDALPSGQTRTEFRAAPAAGDGAEVVFANPAHDFPQRVAYRRVGADSIVARIEGTRGGQARTISFPYRRVACPGH
jgi:hypothetical protein